MDSHTKEHQDMAKEMMDLVLMARGTVKFAELIGKECSFDLTNLKTKMSKMNKTERDAEEIANLWNVINELTTAQGNLKDENKAASECIKSLKKTLSCKDNEINEYTKRCAQMKDSKEELSIKFSATRDDLENVKDELSKKNKLIHSKDDELHVFKKRADGLLQTHCKLNADVVNLKAEIRRLQGIIDNLEQQLSKSNIQKLYWINKQLLDQLRNRDINTSSFLKDIEMNGLIGNHSVSVKEAQLRNIESADSSKIKTFSQLPKWCQDEITNLKKDKQGLLDQVEKNQLSEYIVYSESHEEISKENEILKSDLKVLKEQLHEERQLTIKFKQEAYRLENEIQQTDSEITNELAFATKLNEDICRQTEIKDKELQKVNANLKYFQRENEVLSERIKEIEILFSKYAAITDGPVLPGKLNVKSAVDQKTYPSELLSRLNKLKQQLAEAKECLT